MATLKNTTIDDTGLLRTSLGTTAQRPVTVTSFTSVGTTSWTCPVGVTSVDVLIVGGGGGTGFDVGGGGGGGGVVYLPSYKVTAGTAYTVIVGAGGTSGQSAAVKGTNGGNSQFDNIVAYGGGGGGAYPDNGQGLAGASGGGNGDDNYTVGGANRPDQGHYGGRTFAAWGSAGGGGAGGAGGDGVTGGTTRGGQGLFFDITGTREEYGGGGYGTSDGGAVYETGRSLSNTVRGTYGFGANGTGAPNGSPYSGNSGCVIIRYSTSTKTSLRFNTTTNTMEFVGPQSKVRSVIGLTSSNPAGSAQEIIDHNPDAKSGIYFIYNGVTTVQTWCEFKDSEGWMLAANLQSDNFTSTFMSWNDYANWGQDGSDVGSVSNPYASFYRNRDIWRYQPARRMMIKVHNHGVEFGSGSYAAWSLMPFYAGRTLTWIFSNTGGNGGGTRISGVWDRQVGLGKTRYAQGLERCVIARNLTNSGGYLLANHFNNNNGMRLLLSEQFIETTNTDRTRGLGAAYAIPGTSITNTDGSQYNIGVTPWVPDDGSNTSNWQFTNGIYPDSSNANTRASQVSNLSRYYHYGIFIK
jgi:hypothetical protein